MLLLVAVCLGQLPDVHAAALAPSPQQDRQGKIKCKKSLMGQDKTSLVIKI